MLPTVGITFLGQDLAHRFLHPIEFLDQRQPPLRGAGLGLSALRLNRFIELTPGMREATGV